MWFFGVLSWVFFVLGVCGAAHAVWSRFRFEEQARVDYVKALRRKTFYAQRLTKMYERLSRKKNS